MTERAQALEAVIAYLDAIDEIATIGAAPKHHTGQSAMPPPYNMTPSTAKNIKWNTREIRSRLALLAVQPPPPVGSQTTESVEEAEATVIAQVLAHWFTQGGEARFGSLSMPCTIGRLTATREPSNADELVSQILSRLSCGVPRAVGSIPEE